MDVDDFIKILIPKSKRKKYKKQLKKGSIFAILFELIRLFLGSDDQNQQRPEPAATTYTSRTIEPTSIRSSDPLQQSLQQARQYQANIAGLMQDSNADSLKRVRLEQLNERVTTWVQMIENIVRKTAVQRDDPLLAAERKKVPAAIKRLEKDLADTTDPALREKLERTLANRRRQLEQLEHTSNNRRIAELKVENTLAQLGIIYSQLLSGQYLAERSSYERLNAEISHEVDVLEDYIDTLGELQQTRNQQY
ncbi:MAG: hypothetical protein AAF614_28685 [Chloroflexota bacterium]